MAVGKNYDGSKIAPYVDAEDGTISVTRAWLGQNIKDEGDEAASEATLKRELIAWSICPPSYVFNDTPEVRRILGLDTEKPIDAASKQA